MPTMALCKRWQFISPPIEVGEFLLILVKNPPASRPEAGFGPFAPDITNINAK